MVLLSVLLTKLSKYSTLNFSLNKLFSETTTETKTKQITLVVGVYLLKARTNIVYIQIIKTSNFSIHRCINDIITKCHFNILLCLRHFVHMLCCFNSFLYIFKRCWCSNYKRKSRNSTKPLFFFEWNTFIFPKYML